MFPDQYTQVLYGIKSGNQTIYNEFYGNISTQSTINKGVDLVSISLLKNHPDIRWNGRGEDDGNFTMSINSVVEQLQSASSRNILKQNKEVNFFGFCNVEPVRFGFAYNHDFDYILSRYNTKGSALAIKDCDIDVIESVEYLQEDGGYVILPEEHYYIQKEKQGAIIYLIKNPIINYFVDNAVARSVKIKYTVGYNNLDSQAELKQTILDCSAGIRNTDSQNAIDNNNIIIQYSRRISFL
jgi:hypothetical protein